MQSQLALLGCVTRPVTLLPASQMEPIRTLGDAARVALQVSHRTQDELAEHLHKSKGYISLLLSDQRDWPAKLLEKLVHFTGCASVMQFQARRFGLELYADEVRIRKAALKAQSDLIDAEIRAIDRAEAA